VSDQDSLNDLYIDVPRSTPYLANSGGRGPCRAGFGIGPVAPGSAATRSPEMREQVCIPSLPVIEDWNAYAEAERKNRLAAGLEVGGHLQRHIWPDKVPARVS
jgi:hypothetical protein